MAAERADDGVDEAADTNRRARTTVPGTASETPDGRAAGTEGSSGDGGGEDVTGGDAKAAVAVDPKVAAAVTAAEAAGPQNGETVRIDSWIWSVRLVKTRSAGATACKGGHVRVNGDRVKPAHSLRVGDEVRLVHEGRERIVVVKRLIRKRVGAPVAVQCYVDNSPPPPPREAVAPAGIRDRGAGRPTKRDRREMERLRGAGGRPGGH
ncbi:RNA-binding S4 domain-containing protein [Streptomyces sp. NPDC047461]|uniref:RNA-binding S4 domain-containing protein n=1 Tax=Streptomyces sp. NPDC047461 TaxID=3155619 RepID=UPI0033F3F7A1